MIITKTPFRVSFCGGGSDIRDFYKEYGGCVLSTSINKYMYISIHPYFDNNKTALKYSENEIVDDLSQIKHSIFRTVLNDMDISGVEIVSTADIPSGTGLGSSSSFTVGLLHTLYCFQGKYTSKSELAKKACRVEIDLLGNPIGKQDQYAAACGGLNFISFHQDDNVSVEPIITRSSTLKNLQENLVMFYTGITHDANVILSEQKENISKRDKVDNLKKMCSLAKDMKYSLEHNQLLDFGTILNEGWLLKKELASGVSNSHIDDLYECAMKNGALGGKLLGAGGGGFLLFYCEKEKQKVLEEALGLKRFYFNFEHDGTSVVYIGDKYW
ncbi:GHMP kinase [Anaerocolumna cellulosilytica]|uniref:GHMP kinase n=1 Tax=Anaerocolumna cellulosilytica TaxID=433286 RepID=A0A6S6R079_9FIRM|nr:GHMP kinase [Anaerocolumna cellulosilytica]MBB5195702.1 D-glycero-alpha-D-manno-heptose-7-phosphate kinase [Anaerocolumna cellulosilytica]BCJ92962.1 GHMP kinase [Anaerocolumna cellulosilytica]